MNTSARLPSKCTVEASSLSFRPVEAVFCIINYGIKHDMVCLLTNKTSALLDSWSKTQTVSEKNKQVLIIVVKKQYLVVQCNQCVH